MLNLTQHKAQASPAPNILQSVFVTGTGYPRAENTNHWALDSVRTCQSVSTTVSVMLPANKNRHMIAGMCTQPAAAAFPKSPPVLRNASFLVLTHTQHTHTDTHLAHLAHTLSLNVRHTHTERH